ncbi:MAG TPA: SurA N-terminal domain-containing protein [Usitatibacter sp.]
MLQTFRDFAEKKVVRLFFAVFLLIPFGLFGIDYYFGSPAGGAAVASVGRQSIGQVEFDNAIRQQADQYRQQFKGQFDPSIMDNPEIRRAVLDRLVNEKLVTLATDRSGVRVGDKQLVDRIMNEPVFQVDGKFSKDRYELVAKSQGLTSLGLDERLRRDYAEREFRDSIVSTAFVPKATLDGFIRMSEQSREVSVVTLTPESYLDKVKITPEQVKAYYDSHAAEFTNPEAVRLDYVELSLDSLAARSPAKPEEVKQVYDEQLKAGKLGTPEERRASHILITVGADAKDADRKAAEAKANEIAAEVRKNPASFADVAKKQSQDAGSAVQGGDLGFFRRGAMVKPFEDAAFGAKKGDIVGPVKSDFGYHIIRVTDIKPAKEKTLAEATPEIEASIKKQAAARNFPDAAEQFSNLVYEQSQSLKPVADKLNLPVMQSPWIQKNTGSPIAAFNNPKLQAEVFSSATIKDKRNTSAVEVSPNVLVAAHMIDHRDAQLRPLDTVKADIEKRLQREEAVKLATKDGEAKLKELQAGKDAGILKWPAPLAVSRQKTGGLFPMVIDKVYRVDPAKLPAYTGVESPGGYSLVQVSKVIELGDVDDAKREALGGRLRDAVAAGELESSLASLREKVGVTVRKGALDKPAN